MGDAGALDKGFVVPVKPTHGGAAPRLTTQAATRSGPSTAFRESIEKDSLLCMLGDEEDETADGESVWYVNALGPQESDHPPSPHHHVIMSVDRCMLIYVRTHAWDTCTVT